MRERSLEDSGKVYSVRSVLIISKTSNRGIPETILSGVKDKNYPHPVMSVKERSLSKTSDLLRVHKVLRVLVSTGGVEILGGPLTEEETHLGSPGDRGSSGVPDVVSLLNVRLLSRYVRRLPSAPIVTPTATQPSSCRKDALTHRSTFFPVRGPC